MDGRLDLLSDVHCLRIGKRHDRGERVEGIQGDEQAERRQPGQGRVRVSGADTWYTGTTPKLFSTCPSGDHTYYSRRRGMCALIKVSLGNY